MTTSETTATSESADQDYNIIWFTEACLKNAKRLETFIDEARKAGNAELVEFFTKAQAESRKGAQLGKEMLRTFLQG